VNDARLVSELRAAAHRAEKRRSGTRPTPLSLGVEFQERVTGRIVAELSVRPPAPVMETRIARPRSRRLAEARRSIPPVAFFAFLTLGALGAAVAIVLAVRTWGPPSRRTLPASEPATTVHPEPTPK
jgi:hypothetical protein